MMDHSQLSNGNPDQDQELDCSDPPGFIDNILDEEVHHGEIHTAPKEMEGNDLPLQKHMMLPSIHPLEDSVNGAEASMKVGPQPVDEFGPDDIIDFDDSEAMDTQTDSILGKLTNEIAKQGIDVNCGDDQTNKPKTNGGDSRLEDDELQQEGDDQVREEEGTEGTINNDELPLQTLIGMIKEGAEKKMTNNEDRFKQLTDLIGEYLTLDPKTSEPESIKRFLAVKIEEIQLAKDENRAIKRWKQLIEDLYDDLRRLKAKIAKKNDVKKKVKELKENKEKIPIEYTTKGHMKNQQQLTNAKKEVVKIRKKLSKLQQKELSLDDLESEDSAYLREDKYQKRLVFLIKKIQSLEGYVRKDFRPMFRPIKYDESKYDDINNAISSKITKLIREKRLDSQTKAKGFAPDFADVYDIVKATDSGSKMAEVDLNTECQIIFRNVIGELRSRRLQEEEEFFDQYESDEELGVIDVHETNDEELEKKLIPLEEVSKKISKAVQDYQKKVDAMPAEEIAKIEEEELKEQEEEEKEAIEQDEAGSEDDDLDEEEEEDDDGDDEIDKSQNQEGQDGDSDSEDEAAIQKENELVDLSSGEEDDANPLEQNPGPAADDGGDHEGNDHFDASDFSDDPAVGHGRQPRRRHDGEGEQPPVKRLKKTTDEVEEVTLSSDDEN